MVLFNCYEIGLYESYQQVTLEKSGNQGQGTSLRKQGKSTLKQGSEKRSRDYKTLRRCKDN